MRLPLRVLTILVSLAAITFSQTPAPASRYTLHAQKPPHGWSLIPSPASPPAIVSVTASEALLILIPQPNNKWILKQVANWHSQAPREQTLDIPSDLAEGSDVWVTPALTATSDGANATIVVVAHKRTSGWDTPSGEATVVSVDLRSFKVASKRETTDLKIVNGYWNTLKGGQLITKALVKRSRTSNAGLVTEKNTYEAAVLALPELRALKQCTFVEVSYLRKGSGRWETERKNNADADCAGVLEAAGVASVDKLPGVDDSLEKVRNLTAPPTCTLVNVSRNGLFALYGCGEVHPTNWDTVKVASRSALVISTAHDSVSISVPVKPNEPVAATLGTADGRDYLILLHDGIKLETYLLE